MDRGTPRENEGGTGEEVRAGEGVTAGHIRRQESRFFFFFLRHIFRAQTAFTVRAEGVCTVHVAEPGRQQKKRERY